MVDFFLSGRDPWRMKRFRFLSVLLISLFPVLGLEASAEKRVFELSSEASHLNWVGKKKIGSQHNGTVAIKSGRLEFEGEKLQAGTFVVDMTRIRVLDIKDQTNNKRLQTHLESDDFFSVDRFQEAVFQVTEAKPISDHAAHTHQISGDLTIKGVEHPLSFPARVAREGDAVRMSAELSVDRTKYGIRYASENFFANLVGDRIISDEFDISFQLKLKPKDKKES